LRFINQLDELLVDADANLPDFSCHSDLKDPREVY
jgi:hypothetical protein